MFPDFGYLSAQRLKLLATTAKGQDMNEHPTELDQADEDILTYEISDEELEAAGGMGEQGASARASCATWVPCC
jgi:hypothetical protein